MINFVYGSLDLIQNL